MTTLSALTLVRNRQAHLDRLVEGLTLSASPPDELIVIDMSDAPVTLPPLSFPVRIQCLAGDALPLAAARNMAASLASGDSLLFLDVDCIVSSAFATGCRPCLPNVTPSSVQRCSIYPPEPSGRAPCRRPS